MASTASGLPTTCCTGTPASPRGECGKPGGGGQGLRPLLPGAPKLDVEGDVVGGILDACCGPATSDHGEHRAVAGQHVYGQRGHAPGLGGGHQYVHQRRGHAQALPGVGYHHADIGRPGALRAGLVCRHGVPDDVGPGGPPVLLRHRDCGEPVQLQLSCRAGHILESARDVTPVPGPGARKIA